MEKMMIEPDLFVPSLPTLWPGMLIGYRRQSGYYPFCSPTVRFFYFARNAVWRAVKMLGLDRGEILVPAYHHGVEIEALLDAGAQVKFYRVGRSWDVDLEDVERKIGPKTTALYLIHYAGFPGPVLEMKRMAERHNLPLIEDCALSLLSRDSELHLGSVGDIGIFCLYKTLPVPNGGALVINGQSRFEIPEAPSPPLASTFNHAVSSMLQNLEMRWGKIGRELRKFVRGLGKKTIEASSIERIPTGTQHFNRDHVNLGMSPITKMIVLSQSFSDIVEKRRRNYLFLLERLQDLCEPLFPSLPVGVSPLFYPLVVKEKSSVMQRLEERGIETIDFWRYFHPACDAGQFPEVARLRETVLEIPCHQDLTLETMDKIARAVRQVL
jgi:perosamine synthetase